MARIDRTGFLAKIEALLEPHRGARQLAIYPDSVEEFKRKYLKSQEGAWVIGYAGSRRASGGGEGVRARLLSADVTVISRKLTGAEGGVADVELLDETLDEARFTLSGIGYEIEVQSDRFAGEESGIWIYVVRLTAFPL